MNHHELFEHIINRLAHAENGLVIFSAVEAMAWPTDALDILIKTGLLELMFPAQTSTCPGCEENCQMPVHVFPPEGERPARAFIACDKRDDVGRVSINMEQLKQWQMTATLFANIIACSLGFMNSVQEDLPGKRWILGLLLENGYSATVTLTIEENAYLIIGEHNIPLTHLLTLNHNGLIADKASLLKLIQNTTQQPKSGLGSKQWRKQNAKAAADTRHNQINGSRDKKEQMRKMWASGKYSSRDRCAEEECAALGISFSAARKALRNTPDPV